MINLNQLKIEELSKEELIQLVYQLETHFANSNAHAAELLVELEEKNKRLADSNVHAAFLIEEIRKNNEELKTAHEQVLLQEKLAHIGELSASLAHEINNPLAIAFLNLTILKKRNNFDPKVLEMLDKTELALNRIKDIVIGLKTYSHGNLELIEVIDVHHLLKTSVDLVSTFYKKENIDIKTNFHHDPLFLKLNSSKFQQVIMNFLSNAKDALEKCEQKVIQVITKKTPDFIFIEVQDNGSGIPENIQKKIFEMYFTTKSAGKGTGMGLGISKKIIEELGGEILMNSKPNEGTCFIIKIPVSHQ